MPGDDFSDLAGKVAIVTGSGRPNGIGAAIARTLARNGVSVTINYVSERSAKPAEDLAQSIRDEYKVGVAVVHQDVSSPEGAQRIVAETMKQLGVDHIDILVNNAGLTRPGPLLEATVADIEKQFSVLVYGPLYLTQAVVGLGKMPKGGRIINIGSIGSRTFPVALPVYAAAKSALDILTVLWAGELGRTHGITVNTVAPGPIATDLVDKTPETASELVVQQRGSDRIGEPQHMADVVLLIASEKSRWLTAKYIAVDAGILGNC
ncbi:putative short-chain dehydrogenase [Annulohypoxylon maeteangense]|uniref:putative short-chain dehydrogenase n=1 Tax=Annulohypoxylon maeteangense TaxID=1927788 RepID=UPI002008AE41|nr:putative short-chain dehydrogenase [Annulohypoxylon maeteangense]KAI0890277.1 putative short-chain dehydrogenase [Annulohypoxylon maeteangense]